MSNIILIPNPDDQGTASGHGWSYWKSFLTCPMRSFLDKQSTGSTATRVGSLFHSIMEVYHTGQQNSYAFEYAEGNSNPDWTEALRLARAYMEQFPPTSLGDVLGAEERMESDEDGTVARYGARPYTGQFDLLTRITAENMEHVASNWPELGLLMPGVYLVDFKTSSRGGRTWVEGQQSNLQYTGYAMLFEEKFPDLWPEFAGTIVPGVFKHKTMTRDKSFIGVYVPPPNKRAREGFHAAMSLAFTRSMSEGTVAVPTQCNDWGGCPHRRAKGGLCEY